MKIAGCEYERLVGLCILFLGLQQTKEQKGNWAPDDMT